jgi:hypothetical protein
MFTMKIPQIMVAAALAFVPLSNAKDNDIDSLFRTLKSKDETMFKVGFDQCELQVTAGLMTEDLEFYHDKAGINKGIQAFLKNMREGLCKGGKNKINRHLVEGSLQVFPMYNNGELYGAIQMGEHSFAPPGGKPTGLPAKFIHMWLVENGEWRISRVMSYDHH